MARRVSALGALPWIGVGCLAVLATHSLIGLPPPQGHDTLLHFYRIPEINALWERGVIYSRWMPDLFFGYGSPLFQFYPPLSAYLLTAAYWIVGANAPLAMNAAFALTIVVAALGMYALGRQVYGEAGGLLAAAAYALSPHLLYQTYARASLSDALGMALLPLAALALVTASRAAGRRRVAMAALACAGVLASHMATSVLFVAPLAMLGLGGVCAGRSGVARSRRLLAVVAALALGVGLAAFVWLPALAELRYTRYQMVTGPEHIDYRESFAQVWAWPSGAVDGLVNAPLPKSPGPPQLVLAGLAVALALLRLFRHWGESRRVDRGAFLAVAAGILGAGAVYMATPSSAWLWERVAALQGLQFPWRWLTVGAFFVALACGYVGRELRQRRWMFWVVACGVLACVVGAVPHLYPPRIDWLPEQPTLADATWAQRRYGIFGLTSWGEYTTREVPAEAWPLEPPFEGADLGATLYAKLRRDALPEGALIAGSGDSWSAKLQVELPAATALVFDHHYFVGWTARVDGEPAEVRPDAEGRLSVDVPAGEHVVLVRYGRTPIQWAADVASVLAAASVLLLLFLPRRGRDARAQEAGVAATPGGSAGIAEVAGLVALLAATALAKPLLLDRTNSALVVHPTDDGIPGIAMPAQRDFGGVLYLEGCDVRGDELSLYWRATQAPQVNYEVVVTVVDESGKRLDGIVHPFPGHNCTSNWSEGQLTRDEYDLSSVEGPAAGACRFLVSVRDPESKEPLRLLDSEDGAQVWVVAAALGVQGR